jgi:uncharacterized protein
MQREIRLQIEKLPAERSEHHWRVSTAALDLDKGEFSMAGAVEIDAQIDVDVRGRLAIRLVVRGISSAICGRCLVPIETPIQAATQLHLDPKDKMLAASPLWDGANSEITLEKEVRELLILEYPMKPLCTPECAGLCAHCGANLNHEPCSCADDRIDPRWQILQRHGRSPHQRSSFTRSSGIQP